MFDPDRKKFSHCHTAFRWMGIVFLIVTVANSIYYHYMCNVAINTSIFTNDYAVHLPLTVFGLLLAAALLILSFVVDPDF